MDDGAYLGRVDPATGRRTVVALDAGGRERPVPAPGARWGWETAATRHVAAALLEDLTGHPPLAAQAWDLCAQVLGDARRCPPDEGWVLTVGELDAWRRGWARRPGTRALLERALAGTLLARPTDVALDPDAVQDSRLRVVVAAALAAARAGRGVDLVAVGLEVEALGLGAPPEFVRRLLDDAPQAPGPHVLAAMVADAHRPDPSRPRSLADVLERR